MNRPPGGAPTPDTVTVIGRVVRVVWAAPDDSWCVIRIESGGRSLTAIGSMVQVRVGQNLELVGRWETNAKFGRRLKVESWSVKRPDSVEGIEKYLGSGMIPGIGPELARRVVARFGAATLDVISQDSDRLADVPGIGRGRLEKIRKSWESQQGVQDVMVFLQGHGLSSGMAVKVFRIHGHQTVDLVREDPYRLVAEVRGVGFKTADRIGDRLGIDRSSPKRIEAGLEFVLSQIGDAGHVWVAAEELIEKAVRVLAVAPDLCATGLEELRRSERVVVEGAEDRVFLARLHSSEVRACAILTSLLSAKPAARFDWKPALALFEQADGIELASLQREAVGAAVESSLFVLTGGPGTGKTTVLNAILQVFAGRGLKLLLAAPTGRAARRLGEATGRIAKTLHRLLEYDPSRGFSRGQDRPLEADVIVVDETSMVDQLLFESLLEALPRSGCRLILVGDSDQLPSVGAGDVLADVIASGAARVVVLDEIFRQARASRIITNAHRVRAGLMPELERSDGESDFFLLERDDPEEIVQTIEELVSRRLPAYYDVDPGDIQVLTPMHRGAIGSVNLNERMQALLTPAGVELTRGGRTFRVGDKVMQIRNNYDSEVFNGDIGRVASLDGGKKSLRVTFLDREVVYDSEQLDELTLAWACSVHKSQGSEFPVIVLPWHTQHWVMLQRNLLYTAITRAQKVVVVVGSRAAIRRGVQNDGAMIRRTGLAERISVAVAG